MSKSFRFFALVITLLVFVLPLNTTQGGSITTQLQQHIDDPELTVTVTSSTSVSLSWDAWEGTGIYHVVVRNLTTAQVEQSFYTASLSANVSDLTTGDQYRFSVEKNGFVIAEDVIM